MSFVRQVASDADGGLAQIECALDFAMTHDLAGLGRHDGWWFPGRGESRDEWFDDLAVRPEWQLLNMLTPVRILFGHDETC